MPGSQRLEAVPFDAARVTALAAAGIVLHLILRYGMPAPPLIYLLPLYAVLLGGGLPLARDLAAKLYAKEFGADLLAGISLVTSLLLGEYLVGAVIVLMLAGGIALERFATRIVHVAVTLDHYAVRRTDLMRQDDQLVAYLDL